MRGLVFVILLAVVFAAGCASVQNETSSEPTNRPTNNPTPAATVEPTAQPSPTAKAVSPKPSMDIPPDAATILHDSEPILIYEAPVEYPRLAREGGFTGTVTVMAYIDTTGTVSTAKAVKCTRPGMGFEEAALRSAYKSTFKSAMYKGRPVAIWYTYEVNFK